MRRPRVEKWKSEDGTWVERHWSWGWFSFDLDSGVFIDCPSRHSLSVAVGRFSFIIGIAW